MLGYMQSKFVDSIKQLTSQQCVLELVAVNTPFSRLPICLLRYLYLEVSQIKNWPYISEILPPFLRTRVFVSLSWGQILVWLITFLFPAILKDFLLVLVFFAQSVQNWYTSCFKLVFRTVQYSQELYFTLEISAL